MVELLSRMLLRIGDVLPCEIPVNFYGFAEACVANVQWLQLLVADLLEAIGAFHVEHCGGGLVLAVGDDITNIVH